MAKKEIQKKPAFEKKHSEKITTQEKSQRPYFTFLSIIPNLLIIASCLGIYYAMVHYYLFFHWGIFIYYAIKIVIAYEILVTSVKSAIMPIGSLVIGLTSLSYPDNIYLNALISVDTAWELAIIGLMGILITILVRMNLRKYYA